MEGPGIVVTGARGFVARSLRRHLSAGGYRIASISRSDFGTFGDEEKIVSDYGRSLAPQMRGFDVLVHLAGVGRQTDSGSYDRINVQLTRRLVGMCREAGIGRIIYASGLGASPNTTVAYFMSKHEAEKAIKNSALDHVIFRPSYIVGRDDLLTRFLKRSIRRGAVTVPGSGRYMIQPVYIGDVVRVIEQAVTGGRFRNRTVDLVGPDLLPFDQYVRMFVQGTDTAIERIDMEHALYLAATLKNPDYDTDTLSILAGGFTGNHGRLQKLSNMRFRGIKDLLESGALP